MIGPSDIPYIPLDPGIRLPNVPQQIPSPDTWSIVTIEGGWDVGMQAGAGEMEGTIVDVNTGETFKYKSGGANVGPYMGLDVGLRGVGLVAGDPRTFGTYTPVSLSLAVVTFTVYLNGAAPMGGSISSSFGTGQVGLSVGIGGSYKLAPTP